MSWLFSSGGQSIGISASASVLPMNIQDWFPLTLTGLISLLSKGFSGVFLNTTVQKHLFFSASVLYGPTLTSIHGYWKKCRSWTPNKLNISDSKTQSHVTEASFSKGKKRWRKTNLLLGQAFLASIWQASGAGSISVVGAVPSTVRYRAASPVSPHQMQEHHPSPKWLLTLGSKSHISVISQGEACFLFHEWRLQAPPVLIPDQDSGKASGSGSYPWGSKPSSISAALVPPEANGG